MAKRMKKSEEHEHIQRPPAELNQPNCIRCNSTEITHATKSYAGQPGLLIYCQECGGIISWTPHQAAVRATRKAEVI